ncbi:hypothetical protein [Pigmentiphaga litoralis]|uniref:Uncharacterized protein (UPF0333 family) n=1 Tax=Pigmentiphaga litoralis TaxID=516702 RepID=A0A7Y9ISU2_9BURK|nr:hypothetical protein [Pigmentiphaga litoralis]NYE24191.1 uncharacterized protein (UPF0333 family) [Pigmentiphaga litoralis]NYE82195.1 uncharacterized protein (UPF0333 family) [Pigmentiphaga litoralis]
MKHLPLIIGHVIKGFAILAKLAFLILVVPGMAKGEFANYFVDLTIALLVGRVVSCCAEDQIVLLSRGQRRRERFFLGSLHVAFLVAVAATIIGALWSGSPRAVMIASASMTIATLSYAAGLVRGNSPLAYELVSNVRWLLLLLLAMGTHAATANDLITLFNLSTMATLAITLLVLGSVLPGRGIPLDLRGYRCLLSRYPSWATKVVSNALLLLNLRSVPVFLKLLGRQVDDSLAIAFSIGEVCWQLCMVFVNRTYSLLATAFGHSNKPSLAFGFLACAVVTAVCCIGFYAIASIVPNASWLDRLHLPMVFVAIAYSGAVSLFSLYRAYSWFLFRRSLGTDVLLYQTALAASGLCALAVIRDPVTVTALLSVVASLLYVFFFKAKLDR